jgi:hypothetical protein
MKINVYFFKCKYISTTDSFLVFELKRKVTIILLNELIVFFLLQISNLSLDANIYLNNHQSPSRLLKYILGLYLTFI